MPSRRTLIFALSVMAIALATGAAALWLAPGSGVRSSGAPLIGGSFTLTDQSGNRVTDKVPLVDVAPTLLALMDLPIPVAMPGKALIGTERRDSARVAA